MIRIVSLIIALGFSISNVGISSKPRSVNKSGSEAVTVRDTFSVVFWNLENFFDYFDGGQGESDSEFSSRGSRHWTKKKFYRKCDAVAKTLLACANEDGRLPDVICVAEVENRFVLKSLVESTVLSKCGYGIVHYDSPDHRGIDVGLLYRKSSLNLTGSRPIPVHGTMTEELYTRDILFCSFSTQDGGRKLDILVNHHPSKYGGGSSQWKREAALRALKAAGDSLWRSGCRNIIAAGDFNDTPENALFAELSPPVFNNLALPLARKGQGSIRYEGKWELIDMFFVSDPLLEHAKMSVLKFPFLMTRDNVHSGEKPFRTYVGPRYAGGVSDHCPIRLELALP